MPTSQQQVMMALKQHINALPERCPGYRRAVVDAIADIISIERQNQTRALAVRQLIKDKCLATGDYLARGSAVDKRDSGATDDSVP